MRQDIDNEVLSKRRVGISFDPRLSGLARRYHIVERLNDFTLRSNETFKITSKQLKYIINVECLENRSAIPCFLLLAKSLKSYTKLEIQLKNKLKYK